MDCCCCCCCDCCDCCCCCCCCCDCCPELLPPEPVHWAWPEVVVVAMLVVLSLLLGTEEVNMAVVIVAEFVAVLDSWEQIGEKMFTAVRPLSSWSSDTAAEALRTPATVEEGLAGNDEFLLQLLVLAVLAVVVVVVVAVVLLLAVAAVLETTVAIVSLELPPPREGLLVFGRGGGLLALRGTSVGAGGDEVEELTEEEEEEEDAGE